MEMGRNTNTAKKCSLPDSSFDIPSYRDACVKTKQQNVTKRLLFISGTVSIIGLIRVTSVPLSRK